jgi:hypothetical protein
MIKRAFAELWPATISLIGVITARQEEIEWWLRSLASAVAIVAGILGIYRFFRPKVRDSQRDTSNEDPR